MLVQISFYLLKNSWINKRISSSQPWFFEVLSGSLSVLVLVQPKVIPVGDIWLHEQVEKHWRRPQDYIKGPLLLYRTC
jgi:hypothetical protein